MTRKSVPNVYLKPGELCIASEPAIISTVLGSCISVTLFCPRLKMGAMCHAQLPENGGASTDPDAFRFVDHALFYMLEQFACLGVERGEMEVKLFGGSDVLPSGGNAATVGARNVEKALEIIEAKRLRLLANDVGGQRGRKIFFHAHTGEILLKRITKITELG